MLQNEIENCLKGLEKDHELASDVVRDARNTLGYFLIDYKKVHRKLRNKLSIKNIFMSKKEQVNSN